MSMLLDSQFLLLQGAQMCYFKSVNTTCKKYSNYITDYVLRGGSGIGFTEYIQYMRHNTIWANWFILKSGYGLHK